MPLPGLYVFLSHVPRVVLGVVLGVVWASVSWVCFLWYSQAIEAGDIELLYTYAFLVPLIGAPIGIFAVYQSKDTYGPWCHVEMAATLMSPLLTALLCVALVFGGVPKMWVSIWGPWICWPLIWIPAMVCQKLNRRAGWMPIPERGDAQGGPHA